jgi:hypothetical protein
MPTLPHNFPTLRQSGGGNPRRSLLVIGAGMSKGLVPVAEALVTERGPSAAAALGCLPPSRDEKLDHWADAAIQFLNDRGDMIPKLTLAKALGLFSEDRWLGTSETERNRPRHRVVARFAREGLWEQIWSLNWDCVQESALINVGIQRDRVDARTPWPTSFRVLVTAAQCGLAAEDNVVRATDHRCHLLNDKCAARSDGFLRRV